VQLHKISRVPRWSGEEIQPWINLFPVLLMVAGLWVRVCEK
jgi:hypothetical protein